MTATPERSRQPSSGSAPTFELRVRSPEGLLFSGRVRHVRLPGIDGHRGVLAHHTPMLTAVECGILQVVHADGTRERIAVGEGFALVERALVRLTTHFLDFVDQIDRDRAHRAMARALARLRQQAEDEGVDTLRAEAALCRSLARLTVCGCGCNMCHSARSATGRAPNR